MPVVNGQEYPYTPEGIKAAQKAKSSSGNTGRSQQGTPRPPGQGPDLMRPRPNTPSTPSGTPSWDGPQMFPWQLGPGQNSGESPWYPSLDPARLIKPIKGFDPNAPKPGDGFQQMDPVIPLPGPGWKPSRWSKPSGPILGPAKSGSPMFGALSSGGDMPRFGGMGASGPMSGGGYGQQRSANIPPWQQPGQVVPYTDKEKRQWYRDNTWTLGGRTPIEHWLDNDYEAGTQEGAWQLARDMVGKVAGYLDKDEGPQIQGNVYDNTSENWPWDTPEDLPFVPGRYFYEDPKSPLLQPFGPTP
jgi:hypothetical protein